VPIPAGALELAAPGDIAPGLLAALGEPAVRIGEVALGEAGFVNVTA
jgi:hypothetical protein